MISIIIASRNEGNEIYETIEDIKKTADIEHEIIIIDDCSKEPIKKGEYKLIRNNLPKGFQDSIEIGVKESQYNYIGIFNARVRFFTKNWMSKIVADMQKNKQTAFCTTSSILRFDDKKKIEGKRYGANINLHDEVNDHYISFNPVWAKKKKGTYEIPCVMGGMIFIPKKLWNYVKGFRLIKSYGGSLAYLSLKIWMLGGKCMVDTSINIGNVYYRDDERKPYTQNMEDFFWNRIVTGYLIMGSWDEANRLFFRYSENQYFELIKMGLLKSIPEIYNLRCYLQGLKKRDITDLLTIKN